jgi:hypothetical protein
MSGLPEQNYPAFRDACIVLRREGWNIVSPHETFPTDGTTPWTECLRHDLNTLTNCHGVIVLDGWTRSRGARLEVHTALTLEMPILTFYEVPGSKRVYEAIRTLDGGTLCG